MSTKNSTCQSWNTTTWRDKIDLFLRERRECGAQVRAARRLGDRLLESAGYSALSSAYYTIVETARAQLKSVYFFHWLLLGTYCYWRMYPISSRGIKLSGGFVGATVNQLNVHQGICRKCGKWIEAEECINVALGKHLGEAHIRGSFQVGRADVLFRRGAFDGAEVAIEQALTSANQAKRNAQTNEELNPVIRIYRGCADVLRKLGFPQQAEICLSTARELVAQTGAKDQTLKAGPVAF